MTLVAVHLVCGLPFLLLPLSQIWFVMCNKALPLSSRYRQALDYLYSQLPMFQRIGPAAFKKDLTNIRAFCEHLGHPEKDFPAIHIAGTNGKGSVAHALAAIFSASGFKTGLYTSPHYRDFRERVKLDGQLIPKKYVAEFVETHQPFCDELKPSYFEWTVALAFDYFAREKVDMAIIETGLGGRLDSTNILTPLLCIITNIGFDHTDMLGDTLPLIAGEKAGIIKPGIPVVIGETHPETLPVFAQKAAEQAAPITFADQAFRAFLKNKNETHANYEVVKNGSVLYDNLAVNLLGDYQHKNLCTVLQALDVFEKNYPALVPPGGLNIVEGLRDLTKRSNFIGRWQYLGHAPRILCDSAHNEDGIREALEGLRNIPHDKLHFVMGTVSDKPPGKVLALLPPDATYYFAKANIPRGLDAKILQSEAARFGLSGKHYSSVKRALAAARHRAKQDDLIFVGGSIFVVAEVV